MVAKTFRELEVWQLADELKKEVYRLTATGAASNDFKYRSQIRESSASTCSLISEGFGRFRPREFAKKINDARGELDETDNHLGDGAVGHFKPDDISQR
jgi:four helix bundle protein